MSDMFNPDTFLDQSLNDANDTKVIPVPVGEYTAIIEDVKARQWVSKTDPSNSGIALDIIWNVDDPAVKELLGRDKVSVKQGIMLDITPTGNIDTSKGKNIGLGRLREALRMNTPGQPFSFSMMKGMMAKVSVSHRVVGEDIFAEVKQVAAI